jgi:hypothetical protein
MDKKGAKGTAGDSKDAPDMNDIIARCQRIAEEGNEKYLKESEERLRW